LSPDSPRFAAGVPKGHLTRDEEISPHFRRDSRHPRTDKDDCLGPTRLRYILLRLN